MKFRLGQMARLILPHVPIPLKRRILYFRIFRKAIPRVPETFLEKLQWRVLHDRRDIIARGGDKLAMKEHAEASSPGTLVPETIWQGKDINGVLDVDWGCEWALKPRTGSGYVAFGAGTLRSSGVTADMVAAWRHRDQYELQGEWAYGQGEDGFFLEKKIPTLDGTSPNDVRFFVFNGEVKLVQVDTPRFSGVHRRFYTTEWVPFEVTQGIAQLAPIAPRPERLELMLRIAREVGLGYDFIRVDLYDVPEGIYFGEITPYPTGGMTKYSDESFNELLGTYWTLPDLRRAHN